MKKTQTTNLNKERPQPLGDTGDGETGVPESEQGISNRAGDNGDDAEEFEDDADELEEEDEEEQNDGF